MGFIDNTLTKGWFVMQFNPWAPSEFVPSVCVYVVGMRGVSIGKKTGSKVMAVKKGTAAQEDKIQKFLSSKGIDLDSIYSIKDLVSQLEGQELVKKKSTQKLKVVGSTKGIINSIPLGDANNSGGNSYIPEYRTRSLSALSREAGAYDITKAKILKKTLKNLLVELDHREPHAIADILRTAGVRVEIVSLQEGDVRITHLEDDSREMLFERKVTTDLGASIMSDNKHAHDQVERYSLYREHRQSEGCYVGVYWLHESQQSGEMSPYNALPSTQGMDGWLSYVQSVNGQHVVNSFNTHHTACLIFKHMQCFFEQELRIKQTIGLTGKRVDRTKEERVHIHEQMSGGDHGVTRPQHGVAGMLAALPGISSKVGKALSATGKNMAEICQMSVNEMIVLDGIGEKTAIHVYELLHCRDN